MMIVGIGTDIVDIRRREKQFHGLVSGVLKRY